MAEPWPDLAGGCPDDWPFKARHWIAAVAIWNGASLAEAGEQVDRKRGTVQKWVGQWRKHYGPEFLTANRKDGHFTSRTATRAAELRGLAVQKEWVELRETAASVRFMGGDLAFHTAALVIQQIVDDDDERPKLTVRDALDLARIGSLFHHRAEALLDIPDRYRQSIERGRGPAPGEHDATPPPGLLDRLTGTPDDKVAELQRMAEESAETFLRLASADGETIEATSREVS